MNRHALLAALLERGYAVTRVASGGNVAPADRTALLVLGQFNGRNPSRAEDAKGHVSIRFADITGLDPVGIAQTVESARAEANAVKHGEWKPWFPVIDYDRCTNCMQCLSFCLFGVYGVDERQKIQVQNNDNCKTKAGILVPQIKYIRVAVKYAIEQTITSRTVLIVVR
jgi:Pyruvate/2-oxoacid:ferredoxin oxidoreductase delta subunit